MQFLQALATAAIALLAVAIAWGQWQATGAKLAIDLYDRRFALFMEVRRMVSEALAHSEIVDRGLPNEVLAQGRFLFDRDIQRELEGIHQLMIRVETKDPDAIELLQKKFDAFIDAVEPYLRMPQKMPRWFLAGSIREYLTQSIASDKQS